MDLPEKAKQAPSAPVWNQSFPSPLPLFSGGRMPPKNSRMFETSVNEPVLYEANDLAMYGNLDSVYVFFVSDTRPL